MSASVKVMLSYDYCHFEVSKSTDQNVTDQQIDEMRKDCMRLADKAIEQYKVAKKAANERMARNHELQALRRECQEIQNVPESERNAEQKAKLKALEDNDYWSQWEYDYEDDFEL